jgi:hypothetical protein
MRPFIALFAAAAAVVTAPSTPPKTEAFQFQSPTGESPLLPLNLPGYDLRVLAERKPLLFDVHGAWVEIPLPIFFYLPSPLRESAVADLRTAAAELRRLSHRADWTQEELDALLARFDRAIEKLVR